jgi:hypothetical protein
VPTPFVFNATVVDVHDGDTINVIVDRGFRRYVGNAEHPKPIRLLGGAARELDEPGGPEAGDNLAKLLLRRHAGRPRDREGRQVRAALARARPLRRRRRLVRDLVADLIAEHWLAPWDGRGPQPKPPWPRPVGS